MTIFIQSKKQEQLCEIESDTYVFQSIYATITTNLQKSLGKDSGRITYSVTDHTTSILEYNPLSGNSYTKLPKLLESLILRT